MDAERFEKLADLHRRGLISDKDYDGEKQKLLNKPQNEPKSRSRWRPTWWKVLAALVLLWLIWPKGSAGFPTCDDSAARNLVKDALEQSANSRVVNIRLLALDEIRELSADTKKPERVCSGRVTLNSGDQQISWRMFQRGDQIFAQVYGF